MDILLLCDDMWHPGEAVSYGLKFLKEQGHCYDTIMDAKDIVTPELLSGYEAVIIAKGNALTGANSQAPWFEKGVTLVGPEGYRRYVENGGGLLFLHGGATFRREQCPDMLELLGVEFLGHPRQCPVKLQIKDKGHPIMRGVSEFTILQDEHYQMKVLADDMQVFAQTVSGAGAYPAGMARDIGRGRVCVLTPGHNAFVLNQPEYQRVILNALEWLKGK